MKARINKIMKRIVWGALYGAVFVTSFTVSAALKIYHPSGNKMEIRWDDSVGKIYTDCTYGNGTANTFDLYLPADHTKATYGLVVYLHAGGFTAGDKSDDKAMLQWLCAKGYVAAGVNYTLRTEENTASVYTQSVEIRNSIPAIVQKAAELGYSLDRMAIGGGSAGGCLALLYGYRDADVSPVPVKMIFEAVGPASFHHQDWKCYGLDKNPEAAAMMFSVMSGNTITPEMIQENNYEEEIKNISADLWITENSAPLVCAYGVYDKLQPFDAVKPLLTQLEKYQVPYDYIEFPHSGHGLQNDNQCYIKYMEKIEEYLSCYLQ